jgi:maltose O-acetyltransferase
MGAVFASELVPAFLRVTLMRAAGFDIDKEVCIWPHGSFRSRRIAIASGVFINVGFYHDGYDELRIGHNVRIGPFVRVLTATHDIGPPEQRGLIEVVGRPVTIGDGCWIGAGALILPGVTISRGCVVAASAVLTESTEPDGLYAGNPARRMRNLEGPAGQAGIGAPSTQP